MIRQMISLARAAISVSFGFKWFEIGVPQCTADSVLFVCLALSGCSGTENANTGTNTGVNANRAPTANTTGNANVASPTASPADYNLFYEATKDTEWTSNPSAPSPTTVV